MAREKGGGSGASRRELFQGLGAASAASLPLGGAAAAPGARATGRRQAPAGAPNILLLVLDDVGFADLGCYGGEIATPNIDAIARSGLRYTSFRTTAVCSGTRAALLTGL